MTKKILTVLSLLLLLSLPAAAVDKEAVNLTSVAEVEVTVRNDKGEEEVKRVEASKAHVTPGDTVIFTNAYANTGKEPATGVIVTNPVSEHMVYMDGTAEGKDARIEFSVDKGKSFGAPDQLKVKGQDGKEKPASAADYTHIRWTLSKPLAPGGKGNVSFRARVK